jgi:hypothetical protein
MIRGTDSPGRSPVTGRPGPAGSAPKPSVAQAGARVTPPPPNRPGIERALGDALSIAQMSQDIIQRAMTISLQLKSIAASAIASGRINQTELSQALSEMRTALGRYGEDIPPPAQASSLRSARVPDMPDISAELKSLRDVATDMNNGTIDRAAALDGVTRGLGAKLTAFRTAGDAIAAQMRESSTAGAAGEQVPLHELVSRIKGHIAANPASALSAQGNINYTAADRLMS